MRTKILASVICIIFTGACSTTNNQETEVLANKKTTITKVAESSEKDPNEKICVKQPITGSRFGKKICQTRAQWQAIKENAKKTSEDLVNQTTVNDGTVINN